VARSLKSASTSASISMGEHQGKLGAANLGQFVGVDFNLRPTVYIIIGVIVVYVNPLKMQVRVVSIFHQLAILSQNASRAGARTVMYPAWHVVMCLSAPKSRFRHEICELVSSMSRVFRRPGRSG